jgi:hypothetical protein
LPAGHALTISTNPIGPGARAVCRTLVKVVSQVGAVFTIQPCEGYMDEAGSRRFEMMAGAPLGPVTVVPTVSPRRYSG